MSGKYIKFIIVILFIFSSCILQLYPETGFLKEESLIKSKALDYIEGWFEASVERMSGCLHPDLSKRGLFFVKETGRNRFGIHSASTLVEGTRLGKGKKYRKDQRNIGVMILDISGNMSSVKVTCNLTIEYLHLVKYDGEWRVINVLWEPVSKVEKLK